MATLDFNGTSDYVTTTLNPTGWAAMSVSFWVFLPAFADADNERVIDCAESGPIKGFSFTFGAAASSARDNLVFAGYDGTSATWSLVSPNLETGKWYHVVGTYTSNNAKLYIDGVQRDSDTTCAMTESATETVEFGRRAVGSSNYANIDLNDIRFYNVVLNAEEVAILAQGKDHQRGLVAQYDGTVEGNTVKDIKGGYDGTSVGSVHDTYNIPGPLLRGSARR